MEITLAQLAIHLGGTLIGHHTDTPITGVTGFDTVREGEVTYITQGRNLATAEESPATAIIVPEGVAQSSKPVIVVADPRSAFARALRLFDWRRIPLPGIDLSAQVAKTAAVHARAHIGPLVSVGEGAVIGDGAVIHAHAVIGDYVEIGAGTIINSHATIYPKCTIGSNVIIHSGAVIGADGLGFQPGPNGWEKIPHLGMVIIEDDVEIGALTAIDRATTGATIIGHGTKIDDLVMIAHNVQIGPNCMILSQVGIAGSCVLEEGVIMAGQCGMIDHKRVGAGARLAVRAGVSRDVPAGITASGYPAQPHHEQLKLDAAFRRLPEMQATLRKLEKQVAILQARLQAYEETSETE